MTQPLLVTNNRIERQPIGFTTNADVASQVNNFTSQFAGDLLQADYRNVAAGNSSNAELMERLWGAQAQVSLDRGTAGAAALSTQSSGWGAAIGGLGKIAELWMRREQEAKYAESQQLRAELLREAAHYSGTAPSVVQETEEGYVGYSVGAQDLARRYAEVAYKLNPETGQMQYDVDDYIEFVNRLYAPAHRVLDENAKFRVDTTRAALNVQRENKAQHILLTHTAQLAELAQATSGDRRVKLTENIYESLQKNLAQEDFVTQQAVMAAVMPELLKRAQAGDDAAMTLYQNYKRLNEAFVELNKVQDNFTKNGNTPEARLVYKQDLLNIDARFGTKLYDYFENPTATNEEIIALQQKIQAGDRAVEAEVYSPVEGLKWTNENIGITSFALAEDEGEYARFEASYATDYDASKSPTARKVLAIAKQWRDYAKYYQDYRQKRVQFQLIAVGNRKEQASQVVQYMQKNGDLPPWLRDLGLAAAFRENMKGVFEQGLEYAKQGTPESLKKAEDLVFQQFERMRDLMGEQIKALDAERDARFGNLGAYGFLQDPVQTRKRMLEQKEVAKATFTALEKLSAQQRQQLSEKNKPRDVTGVTPSFRGAPNRALQSVEVEGKTIITPFPAGTNVVYTSPIGMRKGKYHAGIDLAIPQGTPLHFYDDGVVVEAGHVSGYGYTVTVKTSNNRYHRFAHLSVIGVKVGDKITAGQRVGASGGAVGSPGAGKSSGPHLHWEVREGGPYGNPLGVIPHMSLIYGSKGKNAGAPQKPPGLIPLPQPKYSAPAGTTPGDMPSRVSAGGASEAVNQNTPRVPVKATPGTPPRQPARPARPVNIPVEPYVPPGGDRRTSEEKVMDTFAPAFGAGGAPRGTTPNRSRQGQPVRSTGAPPRQQGVPGRPGAGSKSLEQSSVYSPEDVRRARNGETRTPIIDGSVRVDGGFITDNTWFMDSGEVRPVKNTDIVRLTYADVKWDSATYDEHETHGYSQLGRDEQLTKYVNGVAKGIHVPSQTFADVWAFINNGDFMRLHRMTNVLGTPNLNSYIDPPAEALTDDQALARYSMDLLRRTYQRARPKSLKDMLWQYFGSLAYVEQRNRTEEYTYERYVRDGVLPHHDARNVSVTRDHNLKAIIDLVGYHAGRRYRNPFRRPSEVRVHSFPVQGCPLCSQLLVNKSWVTHESLLGDTI